MAAVALKSLTPAEADIAPVGQHSNCRDSSTLAPLQARRKEAPPPEKTADAGTRVRCKMPLNAKRNASECHDRSPWGGLESGKPPQKCHCVQCVQRAADAIDQQLSIGLQRACRYQTNALSRKEG